MSVIERILRREEDDVPGPPAPPLVIEPMTKRDLKAGVLQTELHAYPKPWSTGVFQSEIDQMRTGSRYYVVARRAPAGGRRWTVGRRSPTVGHAGLWFTADEAHVTNVAVHPEVRRSGVATRLLLELADEARRRNATSWTLEVRVSSVGAQALYRRFGFAPAGVRQRYYDNAEDAIVMWCHDIQGDEYSSRLDDLRARS